MELSETQKKFIRDNHEAVNDLPRLTQLCFGDDAIDGRHQEGRAVRKFMVENGWEFSTAQHAKVKGGEVTLTNEQKELAKRYADDGLSSFRIAEIAFPDVEVKKLGKEQRAVLAFLREVNPEFVSEGTAGQLTDYSPPKAVSRLIKKVFEATGVQLEEDKLTRQFRICLDKLAVNLANSRFTRIVNNYHEANDRSLFEEEFVRLTWDKPDLTADELNLYMNVCKEIVTLEVVTKHLQKLNELFDETDGQHDMTVRLAEIIKSKSGEYHQCAGRIETLTKKLQGDRAERMKSKRMANASVLSIVQAFQDEDERKNIARMNELMRMAVSKEVERLENMEEWRARIIGINREDVI